MKRIEFNHNYTKLHGTTRARLVEVVTVDFSMIGASPINYDTEYDTEYLEDGEIKFYLLEPGVYLRLLLMSASGIPFTTYRKVNAENANKYCHSVGDWFEIYVKEGGAE